MRTAFVTGRSADADFRYSISSYLTGICGQRIGNRINTWDAWGPVSLTSDHVIDFNARLSGIKDIDYILNPFFNVTKQFFPSKNNHVSGVFIRPSIHDCDTVSDRRVLPMAVGVHHNIDSTTADYSLTSSGIVSHMAKYNDLAAFKKDITGSILLKPKNTS